MTPTRKTQLHSEEYLGEARDYWWNADFLNLMARRWALDEVRSVLDVGCGAGHWGRVLSRVLPSEARVIGIDREDEWVRRASLRADELGMSGRFTYLHAEAEDLPFADATFEFVTCQTLLMHVRDVRSVLDEMLRVLKPGGLIAVAEPDHFASSAAQDSLNADLPIDLVIERLRFHMTCERGKRALGEGNNSIAGLLPGTFSAAGIRDIQLYVADKPTPLYPPYSSPEQQANVRQWIDWIEREIWIWDSEDTRRFFLAGGGLDSAFESGWTAIMEHQSNVRRALVNGTYHSAGGGLCYLVSGRR